MFWVALWPHVGRPFGGLGGTSESILGLKNHGFYIKRFVHEAFNAFSTFLKGSGGALWPHVGRPLGGLGGTSEPILGLKNHGFYINL